MDVVNNLPPMRLSIKNQSVAILFDAFLGSNLLGGKNKLTHQLLIRLLKLGGARNMFFRHN